MATGPRIVCVFWHFLLQPLTRPLQHFVGAKVGTIQFAFGRWRPKRVPSSKDLVDNQKHRESRQVVLGQDTSCSPNSGDPF